MVNAIPSVEWDREGKEEVNGHVEDGGREEEAGGDCDRHGPCRELEDLELGILGCSNRLRGEGPGSVRQSVQMTCEKGQERPRSSQVSSCTNYETQTQCRAPKALNTLAHDTELQESRTRGAQRASVEAREGVVAQRVLQLGLRNLSSPRLSHVNHASFARVLRIGHEVDGSVRRLGVSARIYLRTFAAARDTRIEHSQRSKHFYTVGRNRL